jgi:hypothetical protein
MENEFFWRVIVPILVSAIVSIGIGAIYAMIGEHVIGLVAGFIGLIIFGFLGFAMIVIACSEEDV